MAAMFFGADGDKASDFQHCPVRGRERDNWMPLTRDKIIGHDLERLAFRFTMTSEDGAVQCQISDAAMDELAGMQGTESSARQAQFLSLRETIERIASDLYDEAPRVQGYVVRIFMRNLGR